MSKLDENLEKILGINTYVEPEIIKKDIELTETNFIKDKAEIAVQESSEILKLKNKQQINDDFSSVRSNYYTILEQSNEALKDLLNMAKDFENARFYEVATELISNITLINEKILELNQKQVEIENMGRFGGEQTLNQKNSQTNYFFGTTEDLRKLITDNSTQS